MKISTFYDKFVLYEIGKNNNVFTIDYKRIKESIRFCRIIYSESKDLLPEIFESIRGYEFGPLGESLEEYFYDPGICSIKWDKVINDTNTVFNWMSEHNTFLRAVILRDRNELMFIRNGNEILTYEDCIRLSYIKPVSLDSIGHLFDGENLCNDILEEKVIDSIIGEDVFYKSGRSNIHWSVQSTWEEESNYGARLIDTHKIYSDEQYYLDEYDTDYLCLSVEDFWSHNCRIY